MARAAAKAAAAGLVGELYLGKRQQGKLALAPSKDSATPAFGANDQNIIDSSAHI